MRAVYASPSGTSAVQTRCHIALVYSLYSVVIVLSLQPVCLHCASVAVHKLHRLRGTEEKWIECSSLAYEYHWNSTDIDCCFTHKFVPTIALLKIFEVKTVSYRGSVISNICNIKCLKCA